MLLPLILAALGPHGGSSGQVIRTLTDKFRKNSISLEQGGCAIQGNSYCRGAFVLNLIPLQLLWD